MKNFYLLGEKKKLKPFSVNLLFNQCKSISILKYSAENNLTRLP